MSESTETWRPVPGWEDTYMVSDQGRVARLMKPAIDSSGYPSMNFRAPGRLKHWRLHAIVALAFISERPEGLEVCHYDGDPFNNVPSNLRYDTRTANEHDKRRHGTHHHARKTHCPAGHEYTPENTYVNPKGSRECRACKDENREESNRRARERRAARGLMPNGNSAKTHCPHGHEYTPENTYINPSSGSRMCKTCIRERDGKRDRTEKPAA